MSGSLTNLNDYVEVVMGQAPPGDKCNKNGEGTVFVKAGEFQERTPIAREWTTKPLKMAQPDDSLVCVVGATAGKVNISSFNCAIGRSVAAVRPKHNKIDPIFLYQFLQTQVEQLRDRSQGAAQGVITREMLLGLNLAVPPLPEQRRIAALLDQAETLRTQRRTALALLDSLTQSLFLDMFGDPAKNPYGWVIGKIGDMLESASYGTSEKSGPDGEFPVLRMNNITRTGELDLEDLKYMDLLGKDHERYLVKAGDVLFNRTNSAELVGKTAIVPQSAPSLAYAGYLVRLRVNDANHPMYLARFLNTSYAKRMLRGMCKSIVGMANINAKEIQAMRIALPPLPLQQTFATRIQSIEALKATHRRALAALDELFASLQQRAFAGLL
ncbi:MAG: restriction endonuclease subunit S [Acidovorax sp.]|uniref:restriction endonuclease subunit S n=1 Tax=Acidovorax sp. TaxID=1872122 RepID=UPI0039E250EA